MAKPPSPLVGFNNNVKHKGRIFHVQTEDSGIKRPHIVTHLFADGGRILKSTRTDYSEHLGRSDMHTVVRRMMKEQHKAMFIALRDGQLDDVINKNCGPAGDEPSAPAAAPAPAPVSVPTPSKRKSRPPPTLPDMPLAEAMALPAGDSDSEPSQRRPPAPTLTDLVLADLEAAKSRPAQGARGLAPSSKPIQKGTPVLGTPAMPANAGPGARYAAPRPAAIFSPPAPTEPTPSLFGRPSISEQSLDEVILSYLAEDLDGSPEK